MSLFSSVEKNAEKATGLLLSQIKDFSPEEMRTYLEKHSNKKFSFSSEFPIIGRGNVLRDRLQSSKQINKSVDKILGL